jgi:PAS domain S-box-containing protein
MVSPPGVPAAVPVPAVPGLSPHIVQFYDTSEALCDAVADFLAAGAVAGEPLVIIATEAHRAEMAVRLLERGAQGADITALDAEETLALFMVDGQPDAGRFQQVIEGVLDGIAGRRPGVPVRAYGEMVDVLWRSGNTRAALALEGMWNELLHRRQPLSLYCAYVMGSFYKEGDLQAICATHNHVAPPESLSERGSLIAEIAGRVSVEQALRGALADLGTARDEIERGRGVLEQFLSEAPVGIHSVGGDGTILWANQAELDMLGYRSDEYVGKHIAEFHVDRDVIDDILGRLRRNEVLVDCPARMRARDGAIRHVVINSNVQWIDGKFGHTRCFTRDVTAARAAEQALELRERQLETITDSLPTLVSFIDAGGIYRFVNRSYERWFGITRDAMVGLHMRDALGEAAYQTVRPQVEAALAGETVSYERRVPYGIGGERFVEATYVPHLGHDGEILGFTALVSDISERKRQEAARVASEKQNHRLLSVTAAIADAISREDVFEAVVDEAAVALSASSGGLFLLDADVDGRAVRLVRSTGYRPESIAQIDGLPLDGAVRLPALDTIKGGEPMWIDSQEELLASYPHLAAHVSAERSYRIACLPIRSHGQTLGSLAFTFDGAPPIDDGQKSFLLLTARYCGQALERIRLLDAERLSRTQAEEARMRAELLHQLARAIILARGIDDVYQAALGAIGRALDTERSAVLVYDEGGVMRFVAQRGLSEAYQRAVEGHSPWRPDEPDPQPVLVPDVTAAPDLAGYLPLFESESIGALGFFPLMAGGRLLGKFMVYHDQPRPFAPHEVDLAMAIANHVGAAVVRYAAVSELERTVRFNEMFTGILGHDLRNPLHAIMTAANVALLRGEGDRQIKPLSRILRSGERMSRMIDQLLDFTRVRTGAGIPLELRPVDLVTLLQQVTDELEDANPEWAFSIGVTGDAVGSWDPDRLAQVFSNLIGNAVQHGIPAGGVQVRVDGTDPDRVQVEVKNQGVIPRDLIGRVFEPLGGTDTRRAKAQGLGLGLFITEQIARAHGGAVSVQSSEELGTVFTVVLPRTGTGEGR